MAESTSYIAVQSDKYNLMTVRIMQKYGFVVMFKKKKTEASRNKRHKKISVGIPVLTFDEQNYTDYMFMEIDCP